MRANYWLVLKLRTFMRPVHMEANDLLVLFVQESVFPPQNIVVFNLLY